MFSAGAQSSFEAAPPLPRAHTAPPSPRFNSREYGRPDDAALQQALSSDEFIRRKDGRKRGAEPQAGPQERQMRSAACIRSGSNASSSSLASSTSTLQCTAAPLTASTPSADTHASSLRSRSPFREATLNRPRSPANDMLSSSPVAIPRHTVYSTPARTASTSSCPATLSLAPVTTQAVAVEVLGELEIGAEVNATEVLSELQNSRPVSEIFDDSGNTYKTFDELSHANIHDCTMPSAIPDDLPEPTTSPTSSIPPQLLDAHSIASTSSLKSHLKRRQSGSRSISPLSPIEPCQPVVSHRALSTSPRSSTKSQQQSQQQQSTSYPSPAQSSSRSASRSRSTTLSSVHDRQAPQPRHARTSSAQSTVSQAEPLSSCSEASPDAAAIKQKPVRPPLHTYTSFEDSFGLEAPRTPEGSPKSKPSSSWWSRS
ncbi:hypothetical protein ACM66B_006369 [Microbotryomycetes sp. NB124-2]